MRKHNFKTVCCSERSCNKTIPPYQGFYLGKRGVGRTDYFLCVACDAADKKILVERKVRQAAAKKKKDDKQQPLFVEVKHKAECGCDGK